MELLNRLLAVAHGHGFFYSFVVSLFEGEFSVLFAGVLAKRGVFSYYDCVLGAFLGANAIYNFWYLVGRFFGEWLLKKYPKLKEKEKPVREYLKRWGRVIALLLPYLYGLRTATAFFLGFTEFPYRLFAPSVLVSSFVWALLMVSLGYFLGEEAERLLKGRVLYAVPLALIGIILLGALSYYLRLKGERGNNST